MAQVLHTLIIEDSEEDCALLLRTLRQGGYEVTHNRVDTAEGLQNALRARQWDCVISDFSMPGFSGISALKIVREKDPNVPFIFVPRSNCWPMRAGRCSPPAISTSTTSLVKPWRCCSA